MFYSACLGLATILVFIYKLFFFSFNVLVLLLEFFVISFVISEYILAFEKSEKKNHHEKSCVTWSHQKHQ